MFLLLVLACAHGPADPKPSDPPPPPVAPPVILGEADAEGKPTVLGEPPPTDPAALYQSCRERVEGKEAEGECTSDLDCTAGGCSGEVCVTVKDAATLSTTCDKLPCFTVLKSCGCISGKCSWTVNSTP
jgi:eight-cysteine-cluster-containing protein